MDTVQTRPTVNMSVKVKDHVKAELQHIAKAENRSVHYVMLEAIDHYITAKKAEAEHQEHGLRSKYCKPMTGLRQKVQTDYQ